MTSESPRPPSVDALARELAKTVTLPHSVLVDCARRGVLEHPDSAHRMALDAAVSIERALMTDAINATGVLLHTNLGRAPLTPARTAHRGSTVEFDLESGARGSRHDAISRLVAILTGAEAAVVVNNNAAAVLLVLSALANGRDVAVSRGESVEIGGGFRIPDVMEQSGARLIDVGTTNRTGLKDYQKAVEASRGDMALLMKIHPSNFSIQGFTSSVSVRDMATCGVPVVADIGSGLLDNTCPWLHGHLDRVPAWLIDEPAAKQSLADGAALVTFSGDKLLGGPQCGIIAGDATLVAACAAHPLMRALRPGGHTLMMLQSTLLSYCARTVCDDVPFWNMVTTPIDSLAERARDIVTRTGVGSIVGTSSLIGAGSAPGTSVESIAVMIDGDHRDRLRGHRPPVVTRTRDSATLIDLRGVHPDDDQHIITALTLLR